jgi:hypothetical protein
MRVFSGLVPVLVFFLGGVRDTFAAKPCPAKYHDLPANQQAADFTCSCAADASQHGALWGTKIFTSDSSVCSAAIHAGALPSNSAGDVTVRHASGCDAYTGTSANGVKSSSWPKWDNSFYFPSHGNGKCAPAPAAAPALSVASSSASPASPANECPAAADMLPTFATGTDFACTCTTLPALGSVWGTAIYTSDSSICRAAAHAGAIGPGGAVKIKKAPGCAKYVGSDANYIQTENWGAHATSFFFDGKGDGKCPG